MPSILFINRVYPPDDGATGRVLEHIARGFVLQGWDVSVLVTANRNRKSGISFRDGVRVVSTGGGFSKRTILARALGYALMIPMLCAKALVLPKADVVVTMTDPPMLLAIAPLIRLIKGSALIHWAQDLYPEVAEELGVLKPGGAVSRLLGVISTAAMRSHQTTIAVGRCMAALIEKKGIPASSIRIIPNAGVEQEITPVPRGAGTFRKHHGLGEAFVVEYSGNMGRAHEFETTLMAAAALQELGESDILFLFVGGGPCEGPIRLRVKELRLGNFRFLESQPEGALSESLGAADLHLVTMKKGIAGLVVPSKFYGVMASERPCLFVGPEESEVARVIRELQMGEVIRPNDADSLVSAILKYRDSPSLVAESGLRGRNALGGYDSQGAFLRSASELI